MSRLIKLLMSVILLVFFNSCSSDAFLFPVRHELRKLEVVEATLINYLENEARLLQQFNVNSRNVFFIEQKVPWWKLGRPSTTLIRELADKFHNQFIVRTIQNALWEDITYGDTVIDNGPVDPVSGIAGEIITVSKIVWMGNCQVEVHFRVWAGHLTSTDYRCILTNQADQWSVIDMFIKVG